VAAEERLREDHLGAVALLPKEFKHPLDKYSNAR
jgi:hypothetical protein